MIEKVDLRSANIAETQLQKLRELFPEVFTEGKVDWERLKLTLGEDVDTGRERFGLNWNGKSDCFRAIQTPSIGTLVPTPLESIDFDTTENLFIEGDNLEVLKLLQKSYLGKVKMMYIDPPYNTGSDFVYPDDFSQGLRNYMELTGQTDEQGRSLSTNKETNGRFHSDWLNMMYPRLFLAKNLLREDGVIFISIDDHEVHNLRALCNEIFGEENFVSELIWERAYSPKNDAKYISNSHDYVLMYTKSIDSFKIGRLSRTEEANARYANIDNDPRGVWKPSDMSVKTYNAECDYEILTPSGRTVEPPTGRCWRLSKNAFLERLNDNRIWFGSDGNSIPSIKRFLTELKFEGMAPTSIMFYKEVGHSQEGAKEVTTLLEAGAFDGPKPVRLLSRLITLANTDSDSIILDFFAGSATTAHAVMQLNADDGGNRKYICVQLPEPTDEKSEAFKAGYKTIAEISKERIRRAAAKIGAVQAEKAKKSAAELFADQSPTEKLDLGFKVFKLSPSNFKIWDSNVEKTPEAIEQALFNHIDHISETASQSAILYELLLKSGFELSTPIESIVVAGKTVFGIMERAMLICLEKDLTLEAIRAIAALDPTRVICLDEGFHNNDQLKTNAVQIMKAHGVVDFRTV